MVTTGKIAKQIYHKHRSVLHTAVDNSDNATTCCRVRVVTVDAVNRAIRIATSNCVWEAIMEAMNKNERP
jgi:hypothetical protein